MGIHYLSNTFVDVTVKSRIRGGVSRRSKPRRATTRHEQCTSTNLENSSITVVSSSMCSPRTAHHIIRWCVSHEHFPFFILRRVPFIIIIASVSISISIFFVFGTTRFELSLHNNRHTQSQCCSGIICVYRTTQCVEELTGS